MAITYNWVISAMDEYPTTEDNLTDVVFNVHWRRNATQVIGDKTYFAEAYGAQSVPAPSAEDFIPYEDLTFEQVCSWLEDSIDVAAYDESLAKQIDEKINPSVVSLPLPWSVQPEPAPEPTPIVEG